jgi:hypothetical protein
LITFTIDTIVPQMVTPMFRFLNHDVSFDIQIIELGETERSILLTATLHSGNACGIESVHTLEVVKDPIHTGTDPYVYDR